MLAAVVAHHNAVGNKTVLVCRKQSFTFVFRVRFHISKLPWDILFLIKSRKYVFLFQLLKWQVCSYIEGSRKEMEMRTVEERKPPPPTSIRSPDPTMRCFQQSQVLPPAPKCCKCQMPTNSYTFTEAAAQIAILLASQLHVTNTPPSSWLESGQWSLTPHTAKLSEQRGELKELFPASSWAWPARVLEAQTSCNY